MVMSMYTLLRNEPKPTMEEIQDAVEGMGDANGALWNQERARVDARKGLRVRGTALWRKGSGHPNMVAKICRKVGRLLI